TFIAGRFLAPSAGQGNSRAAGSTAPPPGPHNAAQALLCEERSPARRCLSPIFSPGTTSFLQVGPRAENGHTAREVADIDQAYFCVFLRSSATVVLPTYQSSARISSKTTQTSS